MTLADEIRAARADRSRELFAGIIGCSLATVQRWEAGETIPTDYRHIEQLAANGVTRESILLAMDRRAAA